MKMEFNDVDSFFRNKDKKKKSKKASSINPTTLIQETRETELKKAKKTDKNQQSQEPQSEFLRRTKEDEEWEDNTEQEVDLTNLRIGVMPQPSDGYNTVINTETKDNDSENESDDYNKKEDKNDNPWSSIVSMKQTIEVEPVVTVTVTEPEPSLPEPGQPKKYIPPSQRGLSGDSSAPKRPMKSKRAPNIGNCEEFPSLGEAVTSSQAGVDNESGANEWCVVKNTGSSQSVATVAPTATVPVQSVTSNMSQNTSSHQSSSKDGPNKYVPPHLRKTQNRFDVLKDQS